MNLQVWKITDCTQKGSQADLRKIAESHIPDRTNNDLAIDGSVHEIDTFDQLNEYLPEGAYTTLRTYNRVEALHLSAHFQRLEHSAALTGETIHLDVTCIRTVLRQIVTQASGELRFRLILDLSRSPGDLYIAAQPLRTPPSEAYQDGVKAVTSSLLQRQIPKAKLTTFITHASSMRRKMPPDINETIMVDANGRLLEGLSSNFFAVMQGVIWTADQDVLSGTTRALVLEEVARLGLPIQMQGALFENIPRFEEAFITSASRAVLPLRQIDSYLIGRHTPGPITTRLMTAYHKHVEADLEKI